MQMRRSRRRPLVAFDVAAHRGQSRQAIAMRLGNRGPSFRERILTPLPESGQLAVRIDFAGLPWSASPPREAEALGEDGNILRRLSLTRQNGSTVLECDPAVFGYRFR